MQNIRDHFRKFCSDDGEGRIDVQSGIPGALFTEDGKFMFTPFSNLGYSTRLGYYELDLFPDEANECNSSNPETIHAYAAPDDWQAFVWMDESGIPHMLGERHQVADLYQALGDFLLHGKYKANDPVEDDDPVWGGPLTIDQACAMAHEHDPGEYPDDGNLRHRIRAAARSGRIPGARQTRTSRWLIPQVDFLAWLKDADAHRSGPKVSAVEELITSGASVSDIQHCLAEMAREATGRIPSGQLWQPCENRSCDNEPVCMNCLQCQVKHCKCF